MKFILLSGKAGVGKSTIAGIMLEEFKKSPKFVTRNSFAKGVKRVAKEMGWDENKDTKGRVLLQSIGNIGRVYDINTWARMMVDETLNDNVFPPDITIVDDWRFPSESEYINSTGMFDVITIRLVAPDREMLKGTPEYNDVSETSLTDDMEYDYIIDSNGDLADVSQDVYLIVKEILEY